MTRMAMMTYRTYKTWPFSVRSAPNLSSQPRGFTKQRYQPAPGHPKAAGEGAAGSQARISQMLWRLPSAGWRRIRSPTPNATHAEQRESRSKRRGHATEGQMTISDDGATDRHEPTRLQADLLTERVTLLGGIVSAGAKPRGFRAVLPRQEVEVSGFRPLREGGRQPTLKDRPLCWKHRSSWHLIPLSFRCSHVRRQDAHGVGP